MDKFETIQDISKSILMAGIDSIDFIGHRNHPTITRDFTVYEIWSIIPEEDGTITLSTIPVDPWMGKVVDMSMDASWKHQTIAKIKRVVENELSKRGL